MRSLLLLLLFVSPLFGAAQDVEAASNPASLAKEMLRLISAGNDDWEAFRDLFVPTVHFTVVSESAAQGMNARSFALEDFVRLFKSSADRSFVETQLKAQIDEYNGIAHVWQTYEVDVNGSTNQGVNSIQMIYHHDRWWIANVNWANNTNGVPLPEKYLPKE